MANSQSPFFFILHQRLTRSSSECRTTSQWLLVSWTQVYSSTWYSWCFQDSATIMGWTICLFQNHRTIPSVVQSLKIWIKQQNGPKGAQTHAHGRSILTPWFYVYILEFPKPSIWFRIGSVILSKLNVITTNGPSQEWKKSQLSKT